MPFWDKLESSWSHTGEDYSIGVGSDKSHRYMQSKNAVIYVATDNSSQRVVAFKPFIESFSIDYDMKFHEKKETWTGKSFLAPIMAACVYNLKIKMPATSVNEARLNKRKLELFRNFVTSDFMDKDGNTKALYTPKRHLFYFNNLISGGSTKTLELSGKGEEAYQSLFGVALQGVFKEINYSVVTDDGFFEYDGKLFPKNYDCTFNFIAFNEQVKLDGQRSHHLCDGYLDDSGKTSLDLRPDDDKTGGWPFGITVNNNKASGMTPKVDSFSYEFLYKSVNGEGAEREYSNQKNANIYIFPIGSYEGFRTDETRRCLSFKPFVQSVSFKRAFSREEVFDSHYTTHFYGFPASDAEFTLNFEVVAHSINDAIASHAKLQELFKFISPSTKSTAIEEGEGERFIGEFEEKTATNWVRVLFSNVIYNENLFRDSENPIKTANTDIYKLEDYITGDFSYGNFKMAARPFFLTKVGYSPDVSLGFFEYNGKLYAKSFKISLSLRENYSTEQKKAIYALTRPTT